MVEGSKEEAGQRGGAEKEERWRAGEEAGRKHPSPIPALPQDVGARSWPTNVLLQMSSSLPKGKQAKNQSLLRAVYGIMVRPSSSSSSSSHIRLK